MPLVNAKDMLTKAKAGSMQLVSSTSTTLNGQNPFFLPLRK